MYFCEQLKRVQTTEKYRLSLPPPHTLTKTKSFQLKTQRYVFKHFSRTMFFFFFEKNFLKKKGTRVWVCVSVRICGWVGAAGVGVRMCAVRCGSAVLSCGCGCMRCAGACVGACVCACNLIFWKNLTLFKNTMSKSSKSSKKNGSTTSPGAQLLVFSFSNFPKKLKLKPKTIKN